MLYLYKFEIDGYSTIPNSKFYEECIEIDATSHVEKTRRVNKQFYFFLY